ncbi:hypothetical protein ACJJIK_10840 [Microbulbifer sp. ZKSA006]|uniref:hypothetical protein n=1 Tax=Microbulbifer sp. ZKSA006 TaxID=3243390 RepID=UPI00403A4EAC
MTPNKEKPIIFNTEMVRAILDGRKTQTRRLMKPQPEPSPYGGHWWACDTVESMVNVEEQLNNEGGWAGFAGSVCPHGQTGDRLWVRETFHIPGGYLDQYLIDEISQGITKREEQISYMADNPRLTPADGGWSPSIHMPRWASRITLEIAAIRIQRIQDISAEDAKAEGCYSNEEYADLAGKENIWPCRVCEGYQAHSAMGIHFGWEEVDCVICDTPIKRFRELWRSVYGEDNWNQNPWVWVIEFRRVEQQAEAAA